MEVNNQFMKKTEATLQDQNAAIKNLKTQIGQMAVALTGRAPGSLPSNTEVNPKEHAKAITTRSGVELPERQMNNPVANKEDMFPEVEEILEQEEQTEEPTPRANKENSREKETIAVNPYEPPIPFPQRLKKQKMEQQYKKFLEIFKKLHINIPFAEALDWEKLKLPW
ncbi:uncharacterized protein LOC111390095 [Olea europaea var. sylvestris]|uniref:uncharacterized protein LOC111390095 n=1 Tax=Olea europaea var. sylvestris TaxID=158386 RepID=UPI000C1D6931|nr:uncharacterized protein LOC111390095 [Olea europaea var. sylvestris]